MTATPMERLKAAVEALAQQPQAGVGDEPRPYSDDGFVREDQAPPFTPVGEGRTIQYLEQYIDAQASHLAEVNDHCIRLQAKIARLESIPAQRPTPDLEAGVGDDWTPIDEALAAAKVANDGWISRCLFGKQTRLGWTQT